MRMMSGLGREDRDTFQSVIDSNNFSCVRTIKEIFGDPAFKHLLGFLRSAEERKTSGLC